MIRALLFLLLAAPAMAQDIRVENPRGYGWWLGDELVQQVQITLPPGAALDPASLPRARAVDYWLNLRAVERQDDGNRITLTLRYQNFYSALEPNQRQVPAFPMRLMDGTRLDLPGFAYVTSPLRPILAPSSPDQLQPDPPYHLIDSGPTRLRLAVSVLALLAGLLGLAWHQGWFPFHARAARPFTQAARRLRGLPDPEARRSLHRAFDAAFGRVLIGADLDRFLTQNPQFTPLAEHLRGFFTASDAQFFGQGAVPPQDIAGLARDLAAIERGAAMIGLSHPWALALLLLAALPLVLRWLRPSGVPRLDLRLVDGASRAVDHGLTTLGVLGLAALALGLAQPYLRGGSVVHRGIGTNLVLLIDRSSSMDDTFAGRSPSGGEESKASAARRILMDFIAGRPDDRIGIAAFSTAPMLALPMTESRSAIAAAVAALAEPGLSQTDVGRGLTLAMGMAAQESATGARAVVLVSDGAAVISPEVQVMLRNLAAQQPMNLYWLYLRSKGAKGIFEAPQPGEADTPQLRPERHLHIFLQSLRLPYHAFEADSPGAVEAAVAEIGRMESRPILTRRPVPRRNLGWLCYLTAAFAAAGLGAARALERPWSQARVKPLLVTP